MQSYTIILDQQKLCHCHFAILIAFPLSFAVETPSVTFAIENSPITNHSSLICAKGALKNMSVTLNTQLGELMFSSQIIYTWRRLRHQSKLYGVRLAQVFPTSTSRRATTTRPSCRSSRAGPRAFRNSPQNSIITHRGLLKACDSTRIKSRRPESTASSA